MRRFLLVTASACALLAGGAAAQAEGEAADTTQGATIVEEAAVQPEMLIGKTAVDGAGNEIGDVENILLAGDGGAAERVVIRSRDILGLGGKLVAVDIGDVKPLDDDRVMIEGVTVEQVAELDAFRYDDTVYPLHTTDAPDPTSAMDQDIATAEGLEPAAEELEQRVATESAAAGAAAAVVVDASDIEPELLVGKEVIDTNGETIGEIDNVILDSETKEAHRAVIKSGGFLGLGEKLIAVDLDAIEPVADDADTVRIRELTADQVDGMDKFEYDDTMTRVRTGS